MEKKVFTQCNVNAETTTTCINRGCKSVGTNKIVIPSPASFRCEMDHIHFRSVQATPYKRLPRFNTPPL